MEIKEVFIESDKKSISLVHLRIKTENGEIIDFKRLPIMDLLKIKQSIEKWTVEKMLPILKKNLEK